MINALTFKTKQYDAKKGITLLGRKYAIKPLISTIDMKPPDIQTKNGSHYLLPEFFHSHYAFLLEYQRGKYYENAIANSMFNSPMYRTSDLRYNFQAKKLEIKLERTSYHDFLVTNYSLDLVIGDKTIREHIGYEDGLPLISNNKLASVSSTDIMTETSDGYFIIQKRSNNVFSNTGKLTTSAGGLLSSPDIFENAREELRQELNIRSNPTLIGISRNSLEGGSVKYMFYSKMDLTKNQILGSITHSNAEDAWEYSKLYLIHKSKLIALSTQNISDTLAWAIYLLNERCHLMN